MKFCISIVNKVIVVCRQNGHKFFVTRLCCLGFCAQLHYILTQTSLFEERNFKKEQTRAGY